MGIYKKETADKYQEFFNFMSQEHDLILTIEEMDEIVFEAQRLIEKINKLNRMKVFISGKITGEPIIPCVFKFTQAMRDEKIRDFETIIHPFHLDVYFGISHKEAMEICLEALKDCTHIYMLKDWKESKGAKIEHQFALENGIKIIYQ